MKETELTYYPDEQITAYLNNELSGEQRVELEQWVAADETHKQYYYEMTEVWLAVNAIQDKKEATDRAYQHFLGRISQKKKSKKLQLRRLLLKLQRRRMNLYQKYMFSSQDRKLRLMQ